MDRIFRIRKFGYCIEKYHVHPVHPVKFLSQRLVSDKKTRRVGDRRGKGCGRNKRVDKRAGPYCGLFGVVVGRGLVRPGICRIGPVCGVTTGVEFDGGLPIGTGWRIIVDFCVTVVVA